MIDEKYTESETTQSDEFSMQDEDYYAVGIAIDFANKLLKQPILSLADISGLKNAVYALERLPNSTSGVDVNYGITYRNRNEEFDEMRYISFIINETEFEISNGGSCYEKSIGSDSFSYPGWYFDIYSNREVYGCELVDIEDSIYEYMQLEAETYIYDNSEININTNVE